MQPTVTARLIGVGLWLVAAGMLHSAVAQDVLRIAAIVNDDVISGYDLDRRLDLVIRSARMTDSPETRRQIHGKVLELLIDEKLRLQAADSHNIRVSEKDMATAIGRIERRNNLKVGGFDEFVRSMGVDRDSLLQQIRADVAWNRVLNRLLQPIPEDEIEESLQKLEADIGKPEYAVSEILIPTDSPDQVNEARQITENLLKQIRAGAPFEAAARQFSRGATAASGGQVGWVRADQLAEEIATVIATLEKGAISEPIQTNNGFYLIKLHNQRVFQMAAATGAKVSLRQLLFALPEDASQATIKSRTDEALAMTASISVCGEIEAMAQKSEDVEFADLGTFDLNQLSPQIRDAVRNVAVDKFSEPLPLASGIMLLMVCARQESEANAPARRQVELELRKKKLAKISQRYIRDLRRDALVEYR